MNTIFKCKMSIILNNIENDDYNILNSRIHFYFNRFFNLEYNPDIKYYEQQIKKQKPFNFHQLFISNNLKILFSTSVDKTIETLEDLIEFGDISIKLFFLPVSEIKRLDEELKNFIVSDFKTNF